LQPDVSFSELRILGSQLTNSPSSERVGRPPCAPFSTPSWPPRFPSSQVRLRRLLGRKLDRGGGDRCWLGCVVWGPDGVGRSARSAPRCRILERSRLVCSHRARPRSPRPGASKPVRSDGSQRAPHLIDGQERDSQTKACIVYHVHLSLRHRHRRAFPPRRFVSPGSAPLHAWATCTRSHFRPREREGEWSWNIRTGPACKAGGNTRADLKTA
jgi:hypothetical protein